MDEEVYNLQNLQGSQAQTNIAQANSQYLLQEQEKGMLKEQLDLGEELDRIEHLLRGHIYTNLESGMGWKVPDNDELVILTEYGVHLILNCISWYINKNTLLSNYDNEVILQKMEDFSSDLNDTIFMEYEKIFKYPSLEDCKKVFEARINKRVELRKYVLGLAGVKSDEKEIKEEFLLEMEDRIEKEMDKIKEQIIKGKLKRFMILLRIVQDAVHSTYNRAFRGEERRTLREHIHLSEIKGTSTPAPQNRRGILSWGRN